MTKKTTPKRSKAGDALALTFAAPVLTKAQRTRRRGRRRNMFEDPGPVPRSRGPLDWMG